ncbi:MAG: sigma-54 dependent transcriptional regulator [Myxococcota bacterium]|nr:sigma-54 dependent transcriptional regulator [Myxococcota bacterium]
MKTPILYVDDEAANLSLFDMDFGSLFNIRTVQSAEAALLLMEKEHFEIIITDERMPGMGGIDFLKRVCARWPRTIRMIISAYSDADRLLRAINCGHAQEYILKPWDSGQLQEILKQAEATVKRRRKLEARADLAQHLLLNEKTVAPPDSIIGAKGGLASTIAACRKAAMADASILLQGETGTGKEILAGLIHQLSDRSSEAMIRFNCGAITEGLIESELFGHERGAFTGAHKTKKGRFELAHSGTLFLDEIGDISPQLQLRLLRVLQEGEFERVGGVATLKVDVRVIAATHRNLHKMVSRGEFREDLYYRLNVIPIRVPPLRERTQDIESLITWFIHKYVPCKSVKPSLPLSVVSALRSYGWPGNVRELENLVHRAVVMSEGDTLQLEDFSLDFSSLTRTQLQKTNQEQSAKVMMVALQAHGGNCSKAARSLNLPRSTFVSRAERFGILP